MGCSAMVCKNPSFLSGGGVKQKLSAVGQKHREVVSLKNQSAVGLHFAFPLKTMQFWNALLEGPTPCMPFTVRPEPVMQSLRRAS